MVSDARDVVKKTLKEHTVEQLARDVVAEGNGLMASYTRSKAD